MRGSLLDAAYYALILRSLTVLEGLALQADKDYKLLAKAYPYMAKRLLTDPSPELRCSSPVLLYYCRSPATSVAFSTTYIRRGSLFSAHCFTNAVVGVVRLPAMQWVFRGL